MISHRGKGKRNIESHHTKAQMIGGLRQLEAARKAEDVAREVRASLKAVVKAAFKDLCGENAQRPRSRIAENPYYAFNRCCDAYMISRTT